MLNHLFPFPSMAEMKKRYIPLNAASPIMRADKLDLTQEIFQDLLDCVQAPNTISKQRFEAIIRVKAQIYNFLISDKVLLDSFFDKLEEECADNFRAFSINTEQLLEKKLCPQYYQRRVFPYRLNPHHVIEERYYYPVISQEILNVDYPEQILTAVLLKQLQKHGVNFYSAVPGRKRFLESDGWLRFFGVVSDTSSGSVLAKGQIFIEPPEFPHTVSRQHGPFGHALQEYLISWLLEEGHLHLPNEADVGKITELDLLKADAWLLKNVKKGEYVTCLFDIMRERLPEKLQRFSVVSDQVFAFTGSDFITQYLMLNPFRFPCLSSFMYSVYAKGTRIYFQNVPGFSELKPEEQLLMMNYYCWHVDLDMDYRQFMSKNSSEYLRYNHANNEPIFFKKAAKPLICSAMDDSTHTIHARKIAAQADIAAVRKHSAKELHVDLLFSGYSRSAKSKNEYQTSLAPLR